MKGPADLQEALFEQLDALRDRNVKGEKLAEEITRADALCKISSQIISNGNMVINAYRTAADENNMIELPDMLRADKRPVIKQQTTAPSGRQALIGKAEK